MSQTENIRTHLHLYGSITPLEALNRYGCMRLASRITELKSKGVDIHMKMEEKGKKRYARYFWGKEKEQKTFF